MFPALAGFKVGEMLSLVLELLATVVRCVYLWLKVVYQTLVPAKWQGFKDVKGQLVLITGAGSGIGRGLALRFAGLGSNLVIWDIDEAGMDLTAQMARRKGAVVWTYKVDLSERDKIYQAADQVKQEAGNVDILVNNAGIVTGKQFLECSDELIEKTMQVNINAHFWTVKCFLPAMIAKNKGHIVTIASSAGIFGLKGVVDYCASKFAAVGFEESLRNELWGSGKRGVKTTVVCPFYTNTGLFAGASTRFPSLFPILETDWVVSKIMDYVLTDRIMLIVPKSVELFVLFKNLMPYEVLYQLGDFFGANWSMDRFVGRTKAE